MNSKTLFPTQNPFQVEGLEKTGLDQFIKSVLEKVTFSENLYRRSDGTSHLGKNSFMEKMQKICFQFLSEIETDHQSLLERQEFMKWFFSNREFIDFLLQTEVPLMRDGGNRHPQIADVMNLRRYTARLLGFLAEHPYSSNFAKKIQKKFSFMKELNSIVTGVDKIKISGNILFTKSKDVWGLYEIESQNLCIKLLGKKDAYKIDLLHYINGHVNSRGCEIDNYGNNGVLPNSILADIIQEGIFPLFKKSFERMSDTVNKHISFDFELSNIKVNTANCILRVNGFGKKYTLVGFSNKSDDYKTVHFSLVEAGSSLSRNRLSTKTKPVLNLVELPGEEQARLSFGLINKIADTANGFLKEDFLMELIFLALVAKYYSQSKRNFVFPVILPIEKHKVNVLTGISHAFAGLKNPVPNKVSLNGKVSGLVIYGANTGGKTSYMNMVVLNQIFTQTGLPIFASKADISIKDKVLLYYREGSEIMPNRSQFDAELHRLESLLKSVTPNSLVAIDEAFTTTEVNVGSEHLQNVVDVLGKLGCHLIVTTHFHQMIDGIDKIPNISNMHVKLPAEKGVGRTDFKLFPGGSTESFGLEIVERKKLDKASMMKLVGLI